MAISEPDVKKLWGLSGGRCAFPGCNCDCLPFLDEQDPTVVGEMAHVIAKSPTGPRGDGAGGDDRYENLILVCPTHHTIVDKAPVGKYPAELILEWKKAHEAAVANAITAPFFADRLGLFRFFDCLLAENRACWKTYGPDSAMANKNPLSNAHRIWEFRKLNIIAPNNARIVLAVKRHRDLLDGTEYRTAMEFAEHAAGFEHNCYEPTEDIPRFPLEFEAIVNAERQQ